MQSGQTNVASTMSETESSLEPRAAKTSLREMVTNANRYWEFYMNKPAAEAFNRNTTAFPVGAVIVKEKQIHGYTDKGKRVHDRDRGVGGMVNVLPDTIRSTVIGNIFILRMLPRLKVDESRHAWDVTTQQKAKTMCLEHGEGQATNLRKGRCDPDCAHRDQVGTVGQPIRETLTRHRATQGEAVTLLGTGLILGWAFVVLRRISWA